MGTKTQKQRKCCYHNLNAKQLKGKQEAVVRQIKQADLDMLELRAISFLSKG
jgi:hypothetical protein